MPLVAGRLVPRLNQIQKFVANSLLLSLILKKALNLVAEFLS